MSAEGSKYFMPINRNTTLNIFWEDYLILYKADYNAM